MPDSVGPTAAEAAHTLRDLAAIGERSRRIGHAAFTRVPLVIWGTAWIAGYTAFDLLPLRPAIAVGAPLWVLAVVVSRIARNDDVVSGWQRGTRRSWAVVVLCSPLLVLTIMPAPPAVVMLLLGALWGVALLLFAVATGDVVLGGVGVLVVTVAAVARIVVPGHGVLGFGLVAGGAMAVLGLVRTWDALRGRA